MKALPLLLAACLALTGCERIEALRLSAPEKINAAWPVGTDIQLAEDRLRGLLRERPEALRAIEAQVEARMTERATTCGKGLAIGRADAVAQVRHMRIDRGCLQKQDAAILRMLGLRAVDVRLRDAALHPARPLQAPRALPGGEAPAPAAIAVAAEADVALMRDAQGQVTTWDLASGRRLSSATLGLGGASDELLISPNGRVGAYARGAALTFVDIETGERLWDTEDATRLLAWLPELSGLLMLSRSGSLLLADTERGTVSPHPSAARGRNFAVPAQKSGGQVLLVSDTDVELVTHERQVSGITSVSLGSIPFDTPMRVSGQPVLMRGGSLLVYPVAERDLGWLRLDSRDQGLWLLAPVLRAQAIRLSERELVLESTARADGPPRLWRFDVEDASLTAFDAAALGTGPLFGLGGRDGFATGGQPPSLAGNAPTAGSPQPLTRLVAEDNLAQQLSRLQATPLAMPQRRP
jgi:hypothetical protein